MAIQTRLIEYEEGGQTFEGRLAWDDSATGARPGVIVAHTIRGRTVFEESRAVELATLGYVGFAIDVYGKDEIGADDVQTRAHMDALKADRPGLQKRLLKALSVLQAQEEVDADQIAATGYCFGGLCALDLARIGAPIRSAVSFHGIFQPPGNTSGNSFDGSVLVLHGWEDPLATPEEVVALAKELTSLGADWQIHGYGNTLHAFTNPAANDSTRGTVYNDKANQRSWLAMTNHFNEIFQH